MADVTGFNLKKVEEGIWPNRLLRIKDMTSYEVRMEGSDAYYRKKDKNPEYNIVSYTWGRYTNDSGDAISIKGIDWSVPKINPKEAFSSDKFKNLLKNEVGAHVEYVWVDIACIDQNRERENSTVRNQIGIQAAIFKRAKASFIWLYQQGKKKEGPRLKDCVQALADKATSHEHPSELLGQAEKKAARAKARQMDDLIFHLFEDHWFSSLWTLQEAFLRKDATILSRYGKRTSLLWGGKETELRLSVLLDICQSYLESEVPNQLIVQKMEQSGLRWLIAENPLVLLRAACHRDQKIPTDRIQGIQQIFGIDVSSTAEINLRDLREVEMMFSFCINERSPAIAQAFVHQEEHQPFWQAYLGAYTKPRMFYDRSGNYLGSKMGREMTMLVPADFLHAQEIECSKRASCTREKWEMRWKGYSLPFDTLFSYWKQHESKRIPPADYYPTLEPSPYHNSFTCSVYLDLKIITNEPLLIASNLCKSHQGPVEVLILGKIQAKPRSKQVAWIGLLVKQGRQSNMRDRIGFCTWKHDLEGARQSSYLLG